MKGLNRMSNPIRLTGLSSGMDTDAIISQLMKLENMKVDKQYQTATKLTYKVDAYKSVNAKLKDFRLKYATAINGGMLASGTYKAFNVNYTGDSNKDNAVTISAGSGAIKGNYSIDVYQMATSSAITGGKMEDIENLSINDDLSRLAEHGLKFTKVRVADVQSRNSDGKLMYEADGKTPIMEAAYEERIEFGIKMLDKDGQPVLDENEKEVVKYYQAKSDESIGTLINRVNADKESGVVMRFSQITNSFSFESRESGEGQKFELMESRVGTDDDPFKWENMTEAEREKMPHGYYSDHDVEEADPNIVKQASNFLEVIKVDNVALVEGVNSKVKINGELIEKKSNNFTLDGISFALNQTTGSVAEDGKLVDGSPVKFNLSQNVEEPIKAIKEFVDGYNALVEELNKLVTEKTYKDYAPLTDTQRKEMSETEQKDWDEKAKSGALRRDSSLQNLLSEMRSMFYTVVEGTGMSMSDIGINTTSDYSNGGKIEINETKLKSALEENPDIVVHMFTNKSSDSDPSVAKSKNGLVIRLQNAVNSYVKNNESNSLKMTEEQQAKASDKWLDLTDKLKDIEEKYYLKFAAMESAMAKMQGQMQSLSGFFQ